MLSDVCDEEEEEEEEEEEREEEESEQSEEEDESDLEGMAPTPKRRKLAREKALKVSLQSGLYLTFRGIEGPSRDVNPGDSSAMDYLLLLWPSSLCALESNRYALQRGLANWRNTSPSEVWTFLGIIVRMGIRRLPHIKNYWSKDCFLGVPSMNQYMSLSRFWSLWRNLHLVDNSSVPANSGLSWKIQPVLDTLSDAFVKCYSPGQELSVDEAMVKYKGHVGGTVVMPKKPVKKGFKIWCCSCACCGYLYISGVPW